MTSTAVTGIRFHIGGESYDATATFDRLPLRDILRLEEETRAIGRPMSWSQVRQLMQRLVDIGVAAEAHAKANPDAEPLPGLEEDDEFPWFVGMMVWAARRLAGEDITFDEAVSFSLSDLRIEVTEEAIRAGAPDPHLARPGSGRAAGKRPADRKRKKSRTSAKRSSGG